MFETTYGMTGHFRLPGLTLATNLTDFAKSMEITTFSGPWKLSTAVSTQIWGANIGDNWCSYPSLYGDSWEGSRFQHVDKRIIASRFCIHIWEFSYFTCQFMTVAPIILQLSPSPPKTGHFWGGYSNFMSYKTPCDGEAGWRDHRFQFKLLKSHPKMNPSGASGWRLKPNRWLGNGQEVLSWMHWVLVCI